MARTKYFSILILFFAHSAFAEHRVFQLQISGKTGQSRTVLSTLDNLQYRQYYPLNPEEQIVVLDSWMCWKRSDRSQDPTQQLCAKPRAPASVDPANAAVGAAVQPPSATAPGQTPSSTGK